MGNRLIELEQQLLYDLTCAERCVHAVHWQLKGLNFISIHSYLGELYQSFVDYMDITAEQIKFFGGMIDVSLDNAIKKSAIETNDSKSFNEKNGLNTCLKIIRIIKKSVWEVIDEAENQKNYGTSNSFQAIASDLDKVDYFLSHSLSEEVEKPKSINKNRTNIIKYNEDKQLVFGYASVSKNADGSRPLDWQGDIIDIEDIEESVYEYVLKSRALNQMHEGPDVAEIVECVVFTKEKMAAMGIPPGIIPESVWIGAKVYDKETFQKVKSGEYKAFSIEGSAIREQID